MSAVMPADMPRGSAATGRVREAPHARLRAPIVAMLCIAVLAVWDGAAHASGSRHAATNGLIVFQAHVGNYNQLFTIKPNGSGLKQITKISFTGDTDGAEQADWSPDGRAIAFDAPSGNGVDIFINIFTVRPDGSGLAESPLAVHGFDGAPSYSPDSTKIAFDQDVGDSQPTVHGIFVANADGSDPHRITTGIATPEAYDTNADWSPDGTRLAFTRVKNALEAAIFVVGADGRGLKRLTPWRLDAANPDWSPDGSKLLFHSYYEARRGKSANLFTIRPDGGRMTPLTRFTGGDAQALGPSWSPDGTKIVWHKISPKVNQLFVMDAHGGQLRKLTNLAADANPSRADWGAVAS
jgi:dipeptidyl aminopeptidase/acylaminoacyl peptidase